MKHTLAVVVIAGLSVAACGGPEIPTASSNPGAKAPLTSDAGSTASASARGGRPASTGVIYVTSQGLYFDTFVAVDPLPMEGPFQRLEDGRTEFGPGDPGYLGGRWWEDLNGNGVQDAGDHFFLCPLLPPGRTSP